MEPPRPSAPWSLWQSTHVGAQAPAKGGCSNDQVRAAGDPCCPPARTAAPGRPGGVTCLSCRCSICWTSRLCSSAPHSPAGRSSACCSSSSCCTHPRIRGWPRTNVLLPPAQPPPPAHMSTDPHQHENSHISFHTISECSDVYIQVRYNHTPPAAAA